MTRPRKPRMVDGIPMADNLYRDNKGRIGHYRYVRPDGTFKSFEAPTIEEANQAAEHFNALRDTFVPGDTGGAPQVGTWRYFFDRYVTWREEQDPKLITKASWRNRQYAFNEFCEAFAQTPVDQLTLTDLVPWWDELNHHAQKLRHAELRRFFKWMQRETRCPRLRFNPFTTDDKVAALEVKAKPDKVRKRLTAAGFREIYLEAGRRDYQGLQMAMTLSLMTTMRLGDVLTLRFDDVVADRLKVTIRKSEAQRGKAGASRLEWSLTDRPQLRALLNQAREHSLALQRCPFLVQHKGEIVRPSKYREHRYQMLSRQVATQFAECRLDIPNPPTFHEIRSLSSAMHREQGAEVSEIQELMAHTDEKVTLHYLGGHQLPHKEVTTPELDVYDLLN